MEFQEVMAVWSALERHGVRYVLIGSMAMAAQGLIRATRDMDVFVAPDPDNIAQLKNALQQLFDDPDIEAIRADDSPEISPQCSTYRPVATIGSTS